MLLTYTELLCNIILHYLYQIKVPLPLLPPYPKGEPPKYRIYFTSKPLKIYFEICRYSDKTKKVNRILNSPSIKMYPIIGTQLAISF